MRHGFGLPRLIVLIILTALPLSVLAAETAVEDPAGLFSFVPPPGWKVSKLHTAKESQVRADLMERQAFLTISARQVPEKMTWEKWQAQIKANAQKSMANVKSGPFLLCGRPALALVGQSKENPKATVELVALEKNGLGLIVYLTYPSQDWQEFRALFEKVLKSLTCAFAP